MKTWKVVCGFSNTETEGIKKELLEAAKNRGIELVMVHRYRKEGILEYVQEHLDFQTVILQEVLQRSAPYTADDLVRLTDDRHINVIVSLSPIHQGTDFMAVLYAAGIYNAVFEKDAYADVIINLMLQGRTRKEARKYYGISNFVDKEDFGLEPALQESKPFLQKWIRKKERKPEKEDCFWKEVEETSVIDLHDLGGGIYDFRKDT